MKIMLEVELEDDRQWEDLYGDLIDQEIYTLEPYEEYPESSRVHRQGRVIGFYIQA